MHRVGINQPPTHLTTFGLNINGGTTERIRSLAEILTTTDEDEFVLVSSPQLNNISIQDEAESVHVINKFKTNEERHEFAKKICRIPLSNFPTPIKNLAFILRFVPVDQINPFLESSLLSFEEIKGRDKQFNFATFFIFRYLFSKETLEKFPEKDLIQGYQTTITKYKSELFTTKEMVNLALNDLYRWIEHFEYTDENFCKLAIINPMLRDIITMENVDKQHHFIQKYKEISPRFDQWVIKPNIHTVD
ncbi:hypothetical protein N9Y92_02790 [Chlamydiales bacterium]|nr:hypothetical protein [Chlamydiales bacterium]